MVLYLESDNFIMKHCPKCNLKKSIANFSKHKNRKDGFQSLCKQCKALIDSKYYKNNKNKIYVRTKIYIKKLREDVNKIKAANPCPCGETDTVCLDFHHLTDKIFNIANMISTGNRRKLYQEIQKCAVLCANCHRKHHAGRKLTFDILPVVIGSELDLLFREGYRW